MQSLSCTVLDSLLLVLQAEIFRNYTEVIGIDNKPVMQVLSAVHLHCAFVHLVMRF